MSDRRTAYTILVLVALVITILPAAIFPDVILPMEDNWENWYWRGQPHPRPDFSLANPPKLFRVEIATFKALVIPVGIVRRTLTGFPTAYATMWVDPYIETAGLPPLAHALEHFRWALPVWFVIFLATYECSRLIIRKRSQRPRP